MGGLPDELLEEIFVRLPAKSIGRLRCLSRSWAATLSWASFVDHHLRRANPAGQPKVFLVPDASTAEADALYAWQAPGGSEIKKLMSLNTDTIPQPEMLLPLTKPCRGLVLLRCPPALSYYVCNPSTGALLPVTDTRIDCSGAGHVSYGLGYSAATREHKLARLLCFVDQDGAPVATRCEVLVLDASAHWRPSAGRPPVCVVSGEKAAVFLNGRLYFAGYGGEIVAFDVADETFGVLAHPAEVYATVSPCLTELGGYLCVSHGLAGFGEPYTVWLLRDYEAERWEKLCCIDQSAWPDAELGVTPVDVFHEEACERSKIMFRTGGCTLFAVDLERDGGVYPDVLLSPDSIDAMGVCGCRLGLYEESLVTPGRTAEEIVFASPLAAAWSEVLKRLPARLVARLNLVCRDWRALIGADRFIHAQAVHAELNDAPRIMFSDCNNIGRFTALEDLINDGAPAGTPPLASHGSMFVCSQPCHGLVIWGHASIGYYVCNPSTGRSNNLRVTFDDDLMDTSGEGEAAFFARRVGLGYDTVTNKHRLVCLSYRHKSYATREYELECAVQNIRDGGAWCSVDPPPPRPVADAPPVDVGGKLFWTVDRELEPPRPRGAGCEIVAMDNHTCDFEVLQGPPCSWDGELVSILELRGKLGAVCAHRSSNTLVIWTMRDYGGGCSWSLEYSIEFGKSSPEYSCDTTVPLAIDPNGHRVLLSTGRSLGWYDPRTGAIQTIYSLGTRRERGKNFVPVVYRESLFRPDGMRRLRAPN
uniref:F-box domain-containing protein n=2 Tax=Setaria italica TaxID=4555 RepID=K4AIF6_SETIT